MEKTFQEMIKESIDKICDKHKLSQPITVPSAGRMIAQYDGLDNAIELFEGASLQHRNDPFKCSAYKATLETILIPMRDNKKNLQ
jgi:hypothetical protein